MDGKAMRIELAAELTAAWLANPNTRADAAAVSAFLTTVHDALARLVGADRAPATGQAKPDQVAHVPAASVRKSLASPDRIISLINGMPYRSLRRHLSAHGLTPEEYRARYKLKPDYPMVAPAYSEQRRAMAKKLGLGRKPASGTPALAPSEDAPAPKTLRQKLSIAIKA